MPGGGDARRPLNRETARSKLPQKKCTGLHFPMNRPRNAFSTVSADASTRQNRVAYSGSYDACWVSSANGIGFGTSSGIATILTLIPSASSVSITSL